MMLKAIGCAVVLVASFFLGLWLFDSYDDLHSPLLGRSVVFEITTEHQPEVCADTKSIIQFAGKVCRVSGKTLSVDWNTIANITNTQPSCGTEKVVKWRRKEDDRAYNDRFFGACGVRPQYFQTMPSEFGPDALRAAKN
jgi:hypothetical protein